ncbi:MAG TPA: DUF930 domain-containing protein [Rhizobiaceae bacterium]
MSRWALPGSVAVHLVVVLLVVFGLPLSLLEPEEEQAINVDLVPPPKPPEEAKAEPPPPPPETPKEQAKAEEPPPREDPAPQPPQQVINPVFQFGDKDAGPRQARDGNSPEEGAASPEAGREPPKQEQPSEPPALTASKSEPPAALPDAPENRAPKPAEKPAEKQYDAKPVEGKKLFSQDDTDDILATAAMGNLPRDVRGGRLCVTELREQLRNAWPPYYPDLLPSFRLEDGATVIDAAEAAFRLDGEWYDLSYRCEVDRNATRVTSFAFRVGDLLPPGERQRRRLPPR